MITTHVLDTALGRPAAGISVMLERSKGTEWQKLGHGVTDTDGRLRNLTPVGEPVEPGVYRLMFATGGYFESMGIPSFFPRVIIEFEIQADQRYHVPLLLSPYGYSTYRGS